MGLGGGGLDLADSLTTFGSDEGSFPSSCSDVSLLIKSVVNKNSNKALISWESSDNEVA